MCVKWNNSVELFPIPQGEVKDKNKLCEIFFFIYFLSFQEPSQINALEASYYLEECKLKYLIYLMGKKNFKI